MVLKLKSVALPSITLFESSVIFNGTQTGELVLALPLGFESSVIFNGTQTF